MARSKLVVSCFMNHRPSSPISQPLHHHPPLLLSEHRQPPLLLSLRLPHRPQPLLSSASLLQFQSIASLPSLTFSKRSFILCAPTTLTSSWVMKCRIIHWDISLIGRIQSQSKTRSSLLFSSSILLRFASSSSFSVHLYLWLVSSMFVLSVRDLNMSEELSRAVPNDRPVSALFNRMSNSNSSSGGGGGIPSRSTSNDSAASSSSSDSIEKDTGGTGMGGGGGKQGRSKRERHAYATPLPRFVLLISFPSSLL